MSPFTIFLFSLLILIHSRQIVTTSKSHAADGPDPLNPTEKNALIMFKHYVPQYEFDWNINKHACTWKGFYCDPKNTTVFYLRLPAKSLVGIIPPNTIGLLTNLRILSLRENNLTGNIPSDFSNLTSLTRLSLNNNSFTGQLPYIDAHNLDKLNVSMNMLNTSIPFCFSKFSRTSFDGNVYVCGRPTNLTCSSSYLDPNYIQHVEKEKNNQNEIKIIGVSLGSALVLRILLCCVRKKMYPHSKQVTKIPPLEYDAKGNKRSNKLVLFNDEAGAPYGFDLEDLLKASAEVLGEGSVGMSYKQVLQEKRTTVVVKRLKDVVVIGTEFERTMEDLGRMKDRNVVPFRGYYYSQDEKLLVYEYIPAGSLFLHLHGSWRTHLDWDHRMRIALSAAKGLAYLHVVKKVIHGNIKSSNILLRQESNNEASLSDYGLNTLFGESSSPNHHVTGYWAPELLGIQHVTFESDVYSFGVLLVELLTGENPKPSSLIKEGRHYSKLVESIVCAEPKLEIFDMDIKNDHNIEEMVQLLEIAKNCVMVVPDQRPTMSVVVNMMDKMWLRPSSDYYSGYDDTPTTEIRDTPSTITP